MKYNMCFPVAKPGFNNTKKEKSYYFRWVYVEGSKEPWKEKNMSVL